MSQVTITITAALVTVVCAGALTITAMTYDCFHFSGVAWSSGLVGGIASTTDSDGHLD